MDKVIKKWQKVCLIVGISIGVIGLSIGAVFGGFQIKMNAVQNNFSFKVYSDATKGGDKVHFINTGSSDAIVLESEGKFALVDAGEDSDNPRGFAELELEGQEEQVLSYLRKNCAGDDGKVVLEFVIGTHAHSDHIGGFDTVIAQDDIVVKRGYLKRYFADRIKEYENSKWDNREVYTQMLDALTAEGSEIIQDLVGVKETLGNFEVSIYNGQEADTNKKVGENENSIGVLVARGAKKIFLAGDMNYLDGDEARIAAEVGKVDVLKIGHHGHRYSTSKQFIKGLAPALTIQTSAAIPAYEVSFAIKIIGGAPIYSAVVQNGIVVDISTDQISLFDNACVQ